MDLALVAGDDRVAAGAVSEHQMEEFGRRSIELDEAASQCVASTVEGSSVVVRPVHSLLQPPIAAYSRRAVRAAERRRPVSGEQWEAWRGARDAWTPRS